MRSFLRQDRYVASARLSDPSTAASLREQDKNVAQLQSMLQKFSATGRKTFRAVIFFLLTKVCVFENDKLLFTYVRAILEVFVLYSIATSDFAWIDDCRAVCIECQTEIMSNIMSSPSQDPCPEAVVSKESFPRMAALIEKMSRREHCRTKIITRRRQVLPESPKSAATKQKDHDINQYQCFSESVVMLQQSQKFGEEGLEIQHKIRGQASCSDNTGKSVMRKISLGC